MDAAGGRRHRRKWKLIGWVSAVSITASVAFAAWHIVNDGVDAPAAAGLLGLPVSIAGLAAAVWALRRPPQNNWAKTLARQVKEGEGRVRQQLLGTDTKAIDLVYVTHSGGNRVATAPPAGRTFTDGAAGALPDIQAYYGAIRSRRLVITGAAGSGKTVLAVELIRALIKDETRADDAPVPVRIPLSQWDTSQPLSDLLVQRLSLAYDWPPDLASRLVGEGLVLPVLDGLDEMDPLREDGTPDPHAPRALAALEALNTLVDGGDPLPVVLSCRTEHYDALAPAHQLIDAALITISPVDTPHAVSYLQDRASNISHFQPLIEHLEAHPAGPLAAILSTPWRLCLTATVYRHAGNPEELLQHASADDLDQHLLAKYLPAATAHSPNPHNYQPAQVHRWLHHLTDHLTPTLSNPAPRTELVLHELWPLAGRSRVRAAMVLLTLSTALLLLPAASALIDPVVACEIFVGLAAITSLYTLMNSSSPPFRIHLQRLLTPRVLREIAAGSAWALPFGIFIGLILGSAAGNRYGLIGGLAIWVALAAVILIASAFEEEPTGAVTPRKIIRQDAATGLAVWLISGLPAGLLATLAGGHALGIVIGLAVGFMLAFGLTPAGSASRRYFAFLLCTRGRLPFRLARFLDWACTAGLMRYSGSAYQFRHRELQQWCTQHRP